MVITFQLPGYTTKKRTLGPFASGFSLDKDADAISEYCPGQDFPLREKGQLRITLW